MSYKYNIKSLCEVMNVNRSSYYKWLSHKDIKNVYEQDREIYSSLIRKCHEKHKAYGYHSIATYIRTETKLEFSDNLIHKCCKFMGIQSNAGHHFYKYNRPGNEHIIYPNIIKNNWNTNKPLEKIVTDMTCMKYQNQLYDVVLYMDAFNNEIIGFAYSKYHNASKPYYKGLEQVLDKLKGIEHPTVLHSD